MSCSTKLDLVCELASNLIHDHGLSGWSFTYNRRKTEMGLCLYDPKVIALSTYFVEMNPDDAIRDTILHEIAHALVGPHHGHDEAWRQKCQEIGAQPERLCYDVNMPIGRWQALCSGCGTLHHKHRKPKHLVGWHCRHCGRDRGKLIWNRAR